MRLTYSPILHACDVWGDITQSFHLDTFGKAETDQTFTRVEGHWRVLLKEAQGTTHLVRSFEFPGVWTITNYFTPVLEGFGGPSKAIGTGVLTGGTWRGLHNVEYPIDWLNSVDPANEGLGLIGNTIVRFHDVRPRKGITAWSGLHDGDDYYLSNPDPDQGSGSCENILGTRDSYAARSRKLKCGAEVMIQNVPGVWVKRDTGGGLADLQLDLYIGEGGSGKKAQANAWGRQQRWVIRLASP